LVALAVAMEKTSYCCSDFVSFAYLRLGIK